MGILKTTSAVGGVAVLNQVHLTMMLVVFYLPVRLKGCEFQKRVKDKTPTGLQKPTRAFGRV